MTAGMAAPMPPTLLLFVVPSTAVRVPAYSAAAARAMRRRAQVVPRHYPEQRRQQQRQWQQHYRRRGPAAFGLGFGSSFGGLWFGTISSASISSIDRSRTLFSSCLHSSLSSSSKGADDGNDARSQPNASHQHHHFPPAHPVVERARTRSTSSHLAFDRSHLWHPYSFLPSSSSSSSSSSQHAPWAVLPVASASGCRITLEGGPGEERGVELVDGMSSWWAAVHGYSHPELDRAVRDQLTRMSHVMFGGLTHRPAAELAELLLLCANGNGATATRARSGTGRDAGEGMLRSPLTKVFLADSGSVSVEVALKMSIQYQRGRGRPERTKFVSVRGGYHGDTLGCMGVCDPITGMHAAAFANVVPTNIFVSRPPCEPSKRLFTHSSAPRPRGCQGCTCGGDGSTHDEALASSMLHLESTLEQNSDVVAAVILEPLVQGAGGMRFYPPAYLRHARDVCDAHGVLLICDEIATGFGRAGVRWDRLPRSDEQEKDLDDNDDNDNDDDAPMFASHAAGIQPDIMTVGKALTGGYVTLGAALATDDVADGVNAVPPPHPSHSAREEADGSAAALPLMHGPTFMANPLACSVATASVSMLLRCRPVAANGDDCCDTTASLAITSKKDQPMWLYNVARIESMLRSNLQHATTDMGNSLSAVADVRVSGAIGVIELTRPLDNVSVARRCVELGAWLRPFGRLLYCMPPYVISEDELKVVTDAMLTIAEEEGRKEK